MAVLFYWGRDPFLGQVFYLDLLPCTVFYSELVDLSDFVLCLMFTQTPMNDQLIKVWAKQRAWLIVGDWKYSPIITNYLEPSQYHKRELVVASSDCCQVPTRILCVCAGQECCRAPICNQNLAIDFAVTTFNYLFRSVDCWQSQNWGKPINQLTCSKPSSPRRSRWGTLHKASCSG